MKTKALCVGLNTYPSSPLRGCVNDVSDLVHFVADNCGFDPKNVRMLTDERATTQAILERLDWLVTDLIPGDEILFQYSGHGAQLATRDPQGEVDSLDECLCPIDFDWSDEHAIRDKQLHEIFDRVPEGVHAIFVNDSCHSGTSLRDGNFGGRLSRCLIPPEDIAWRHEAAKRSGFKALGLNTVPNVALIAGCREDQTSADASFNGRSNGALTYFLLQELGKKDGLQVNLQTLVQRIRYDLTQASYSQIPQLEGPESLLAKTFFGV